MPIIHKDAKQQRRLQPSAAIVHPARPNYLRVGCPACMVPNSAPPAFAHRKNTPLSFQYVISQQDSTGCLHLAPATLGWSSRGPSASALSGAVQSQQSTRLSGRAQKFEGVTLSLALLDKTSFPMNTLAGSLPFRVTGGTATSVFWESFCQEPEGGRCAALPEFLSLCVAAKLGCTSESCIESRRAAQLHIKVLLCAT